MTSLADRTIAALRSTSDQLATTVAGLTDDQLGGPSGSSDWSIAQVLSHLGSGAEITRAGLRAAVAGEEGPGQEFNQAVWDRWNAMSPHDQATSFLARDAELVAAFEGLTHEQREAGTVPLGFLPQPLPMAAFAGMRLQEAALHGWDVRVGLDADATVDDEVAGVQLDHLSGGLGFLLGFTGKADQLDELAAVGLAEGLVLEIGDSVGLRRAPGDVSADTNARFAGEREAALRLLAGRLTDRFAPVSARVEGAVTLDDLRRVFPGY